MSSFDSKTSIFCGGKFPKIYHPDASLGQVLLYHCSKYPNKVVQINADDGIELSCADVSKIMKQTAGFVLKMSLKFGDVVGFCGENSTYLAPAVFGCILLGSVIHPVDTSLSDQEIADIYNRTNPKIVFCDHDQTKKVQNALKLLKNESKIVSLTDKVEGFLHITDAFEETDSDANIPHGFNVPADKMCAAILQSSGSTGAPKLTRISHAQLLESLYALNSFVDDKLLLNYYTLSWISGVCSLVHCVLNQHKRLITREAFTPKGLVDMIEKFKVTQVHITPTRITSLLEYLKVRRERFDFSSLKCLGTGGWFISEQTLKAMESQWSNGRVLPMYGLTERRAALMMQRRLLLENFALTLKRRF